jgi:hypothetical protein
MRTRLALQLASARFFTDIRSSAIFSKRFTSSQAAFTMDEYSTTVTPGQLGAITLQRDKALNAISLGKKGSLSPLSSWCS